MHFATILWRLKKPTGTTCIFIGFLFGQPFSALPETLPLCQNYVAAGFLCHPEKEEGGDPKDVGAWPWLRMCSVLQVEEAASLASLVMPCSPQPALRGLTVNVCTQRHTGILKRNSHLRYIWFWARAACKLGTVDPSILQEIKWSD